MRGDLSTSRLWRSRCDPVVVIFSDEAGDLMESVVEVRQPGVTGRGSRHGAGARCGRHPGERSCDSVTGGDGAAGVIHHRVVIVLLQRGILVPPGLPVSLGVVKTRGVSLGAALAGARSLFPVG